MMVSGPGGRYPAVLRYICVEPSHCALNIDSVPDRIDRARELGENTIAGRLENAPLYSVILGSITSLRSIFIRVSVPSTSASISRE